MADIRIKDLATTASSTAADDFLAVDGTTNGTRKLSAATPSFATSVTVPGVAGPTATDLTLAGGSTGASLVLGQGVNGNALLNPAGAGRVAVTAGQSDVTPGILVWDSAALAANIGGGIGFGGAYTGTTVTQWASIRGKKLDGTDGNFGGYLAFFTRDNGGPITERSRISATGNLLIGTTTDGGQKLQVNGAARVSGVTTVGGGSNDLLRLEADTAGNGGYLMGRNAADTDYTPLILIGNGLTLKYRTSVNSSANALTIASTGAATFAGAVTVTGSGGSSDSFKITGDTAGIGLQVGTTGTVNLYRAAADKWATDDAFSVGGAFTPLGNIYFPTNSNLTSSGSIGTQASAGLSLWSKTGSIYDFTIYDAAGNLAVTMPTGTRNLSIASTTPSNGPSSGALQVAGGIYSGAASVFGGAVTAGGALAISASGQANAKATITNTDTASYAHLDLSSSSAQNSSLYQFGSTYTTSGRYIQGSTMLEAGGAGGLNLATSAATPIRFYTNGDNLRLTIDSTGAATFAGTVIAPAATTAISSVRLPHGTAPTSPVNGDMWTTTAGLYVRIDGVTVGPLS